MSISIDISSLLSYLRSTSNLALSCAGFHRLVKSNGFPIKTSKGELRPGNLSFYKSLDYPNLDQWTINEFTKAIKTDDSDRLLLLLKSGANIEASAYDRNTALIMAAAWGETECLQLLLEHKANIEVKNNYGNTPLIWAATNGITECLQTLLEYKANIEAKNMYGEAALLWAARNGETECLQTLLENGAKVDPGTRERFPQYADSWPDSTL